MLKAPALKLIILSTILGQLLIILSSCIPNGNGIHKPPSIREQSNDSLFLDYSISASSNSISPASNSALCNGESIKIEVLEENYPVEGEDGILFFVNGQAMRKKEHFIQAYISSMMLLENNSMEEIAYNVDLATRDSKAEGGSKWESIRERVAYVKGCEEPFPIIGVRPNWANPNRFNLYLKNAKEIKAYLLVKDKEFTQEKIKSYFLDKEALSEEDIRSIESSLATKKLTVFWEIQSSNRPQSSSLLLPETEFEFEASSIAPSKELFPSDRGAHILAKVEGLNTVGKATINFDNQYAFSAQYGIIRALSETKLVLSEGKSLGRYDIGPLGRVIDFDKIVKETRFCNNHPDKNSFNSDPPKEPLLERESKLTLEEYKAFEKLINFDESSRQVSFKEFNPYTIISGNVPLPFEAFTTQEGATIFYARKKKSGDSICGISYYFIGETKIEGEKEKRGEIVLHFDAHINPYLIEEVNVSDTHPVEAVAIAEESVTTELIDLEREKTSIVSEEERSFLSKIENTEDFLELPEDPRNFLESPEGAGEPPAEDQPPNRTIMLSEEDLFYLLGDTESPSSFSEASPSPAEALEAVDPQQEHCFDWSEERESERCDFSKGKWGWVVMPSFVVNAKKGDAFLTTGCDFTTHVLNQVNPPQRYPHNGIMIENHYMIRHSIGSFERAISYVENPPRIPDEKLKYFWPGTINQIVTKAVDGQYLEDPDNENNFFRITGLNPFNHRIECRDKEIFVPIIIKPPPEEELKNPRVREILHEIADKAKEIEGYYSLYDFSNFKGPEEAMGDDNDWFKEKLNAVCSTFVRLAAIRSRPYKEEEFTLEGDTLETFDLENGAEGAHYSNSPDLKGKNVTDLEIKGIKDGLDGLYFYDREERLEGAEFIYNDIRRTLINTVGGRFVAFLIDLLIKDATTSIPNQVANCFVLGECEPLDPEKPNKRKWKNVGVGLTVSPDNLLFWDSPIDGKDGKLGGVYGYHEPIEYSPKRFILVRQGVWVEDK